MGLDTSHDCGHFSYGGFMNFRADLVKVAWGLDINTLSSYGGNVPMPQNTLTPLIDHSDCEGDLAVKDLIPLAEKLEELSPNLSDYAKPRALQFAQGCRHAASKNQKVTFS